MNRRRRSERAEGCGGVKEMYEGAMMRTALKMRSRILKSMCCERNFGPVRGGLCVEEQR